MKTSKKRRNKWVWIILAIVIIAIIVGVLLWNRANPKKVENPQDILLTEVLSMQENYNSKRSDLITKYKEVSKLKDSDFENVVFYKYKGEFKATKDSFYFIGDNQELQTIAKNLGVEFFQKDRKPVIPVIKNLVSFQEADTVFMTGEFMDSQSGIVSYNFKIKEVGGTFQEYVTDKNQMLVDNLKLGARYAMVLEITDRENHKVVSPEYHITLTNYIK